MRLGKPDAVAVVICGSTKTVAMGVPLISVMYKQVPYAGLLALPLIVYHALQVLLGGIMLDPLRKWCLSGANEGKAAGADSAAAPGAPGQQLPVSSNGAETSKGSSKWGLFPAGMRQDKNGASNGSAGTV
jgi:sodium/bile acid cotransporter 7